MTRSPEVAETEQTLSRRSSVDPVTFEIVKNKLVRVVEEGITALQNCSGTAITSEMQDLLVALYRPNGELVVSGLGFLHHITAAMKAVRYVAEHFADNPGINENDVWFHNDQYVGAFHPPDVYVISPIHWEGELRGFVATFVHVTDIGATSPGGFCPTARSGYDEGFMSRGIKIVDGGTIRRDVWETILNHSRDPGMLALDLKSQMAANHTAKERMRQLYAEYGADVVDSVGQDLVDQSEELLRARLRKLPDGTWTARTYYDLPADIRRMVLTVRKEGDNLTFDCTGTDGPSVYAINCARHAAFGAIVAPIFPMLAWDLFWNEGILRPLSFDAPDGTLVTAEKPSPMSLATIGPVQAMNTLAASVAAKILGASEEYRLRAMGTWAGAYLHFHYAGLNQDGEYVVAATTESVALAGGARAFRDGVTTGGDVPNVVLRQANVETHEGEFPLRTMYRRLVPDSGGPGKFRGGVTQEMALTPWGSPNGEMEIVFMPGRGTLAPVSQGIFGGYPGCTTAISIFRKGNVDEAPFGREETRGESEEILDMGDVHLADNDIFYARWTGGGGYGDPLDRDPELVLKDVLQGFVTNRPANDIYGVVIDRDRGVVDADGTEQQRLAIRTQRLGRPPMVDTHKRHSIAASGRPLGEYLHVILGSDGLESVQCTWCGQSLGVGNATWKSHAATRTSPPSISGPQRPETGPFSLREYFCPGCATLLDVELVYKDDPPIFDEIVNWPEPALGEENDGR
jgi:N-methylhydantoinase B